MKQLGNLAMVCAQRPEVLMKLHHGMVSVYAGNAPQRAILHAPWDDDAAISRIVHELNFGRYAPKNTDCKAGETCMLTVLGARGPSFYIHPAFEALLTEQDINYIMDTALRGGVYGWCSQVDMEGEPLDSVPSRHLAKGGTLSLKLDGPNGEIHHLDLDKFLNGLKQYLEECCHFNIEYGIIDPREVDHMEADAIVQYALFGEVRYEW